MGSVEAMLITEERMPQRTHELDAHAGPAGTGENCTRPRQVGDIGPQGGAGDIRRWYVVNTKRHQEARAELNLRRQGFRVWLPRFRKACRRARKLDTVIVPLFPSYMFVRLDSEAERWRSINSTLGVVRLLCNGDIPQAVPDGLIDDIMQRCDANGLVEPSPRRFAVGQALRVVAGPFADLQGICEGMSGRDRVILLLSILGREVRATVPSIGVAA
jgi:transcriptional antiterminator RfaH